MYMSTLIALALGFSSASADEALKTELKTRPDFGEVKNGEISEEIDDMFMYYDEETPGCAVLVVHEGEVVHAGGYGQANLEEGIPFRPNTSTRLGSVGKQFAAMAIMVLNDRGALGFDDSIVTYIPELEERYGDQITIRHLLNHTSGLPDYYNAAELLPEDRMPVNEDLAELYAGWGEPVAAPGDRYAYSNPGYELLGLIIQRVSGKSFSEFLHEAIFAPLKMKGALAYESKDTVIPNRAFGYQPTEDGFERNDDHVLNWMMGAGGVYMSLQDLYLWDQALYTEKLVSTMTLEEAFSETPLNDGTVSSYGFGWQIGEFDGTRRISHGGAWVGFRTTIARHPEKQLTVVMLGNRADFTAKYLNEICRLYLDVDEEE